MSTVSASTGADRPRVWLFLTVALLAVSLDLATKELAFREAGRRAVLPGVFEIWPTYNDGVVWGTFQGRGKNVLFIIISAAAVPLIVQMFVTFRERRLLTALALGGVLGGTLGNLYDRIVHSGVRDHIQVFIVSYAWPTFNVADAFICTGAVLFALCVLMRKEQKGTAPGPLAAGTPAPKQA